MKDFQIFNFNFIFNYFMWVSRGCRMKHNSIQTWVSCLSKHIRGKKQQKRQMSDTENWGSYYINCSQGVPFLCLSLSLSGLLQMECEDMRALRTIKIFFLFVVSAFYKKLIWEGNCLEVIVFYFLFTLFPPPRIQLRW